MNFPPPVVSRAEQVEQVGQHGQGVVNQLWLARIEVTGDMARLFGRQREAQTEAAVPDAAMVSAMVTHDGEVVGKRHQNPFVEPILVGDLLPVIRLGQIFQPTREMAQGHQLAGDPDGGETNSG